jgi:hypothetical protein
VVYGWSTRAGERLWTADRPAWASVATMRTILLSLLLCGVFAAPAAAQVASPAVPPSAYNARWPREPASGPAVSTPVAVPAPDTGGTDWTLPSIAIGALLIAAGTAIAARPRARAHADERTRIPA